MLKQILEANNNNMHFLDGGTQIFVNNENGNEAIISLKLSDP